MKILYIIASIIVISGCSTMPAVDLQNAWIGQPLINLEKHPEFGVPTERMPLSDGSMAYVYQFYGTVHSNYTFIGDIAVSHSNQAHCTFTFYSREKVVTGLIWNGRCRIDGSRLPRG